MEKPKLLIKGLNYEEIKNKRVGTLKQNYFLSMIYKKNDSIRDAGHIFPFIKTVFLSGEQIASTKYGFTKQEITLLEDIQKFFKQKHYIVNNTL